MELGIAEVPWGVCYLSEEFVLGYLNFLDIGLGCMTPDFNSISKGRTDDGFLQ